MRLGERLMLSGWGRGLGTRLGEWVMLSGWGRGLGMRLEERVMLSGWGEGPRNEPADLDQCALRESFTLTVVRAID